MEKSENIESVKRIFLENARTYSRFGIERTYAYSEIWKIYIFIKID